MCVYVCMCRRAREKEEERGWMEENMKQVRRQSGVETFISPRARVCKCVREKMDGGKQQYIEQRQSNKQRMLIQLA